MTQPSRRVVFLDRDGTLNEDMGYVHLVSDWKFTDRAIDALYQLTTMGFALAVVSNQSGIGTGRYTAAQADTLHQWVSDRLRSAGVPLSAIAYCPHAPTDGCLCRKPRPALATQVEGILGSPIDYTNSWTIGDKPSDVEFGQTIGTRTVLLTSRYWTADQAHVKPTFFAGSLFEAAQLLCSAGLTASISTSRDELAK